MQDIQHFVAWIDYLIASDDPADQALATEFRRQSWALRELVDSAITEASDSRDVHAWLEEVEAQQRVCSELTLRIYERAQALVAAGASPADAETVAQDWRARAHGHRRVGTLKPGARSDLPMRDH